MASLLEALLFDTPVALKNENRPPKQEPIRKRYQELFPNGRGKTYWAIVTKEINASGLSCDIRTVQNALAGMN